MHVPIFRIFYSTTFTLLTLLLTALLLITPGDHIYQAFSKRELYNIFIVAGAYLLTLLIAAFIYAGRLYTNRSTLASVPRELILGLFGEEKGNNGKGRGGEGTGVPRRVRRMVREGVERSRWISRVGRPRDMRKDTDGHTSISGTTDHRSSRPSSSSKEKQLLEARPDSGKEPVWGTISHPGWSSPNSTDLPNLHLAPIILELPHLIEAKAVSLAPPSLSTHPDTSPEPAEQPASSPSPLAISLLQRPAPMGLRDYLTHLTSLSLINPPSLATTFLVAYEHARFSCSEITERDFRALMGVFAEILRGMKSLPQETLEELKIAEDEDMAGDDLEQGGAEWFDPATDGAQDNDRSEDPPRRSAETTSTVAHTPLPPTSMSNRSSTSLSAAHPSTPSASSRRGLRTPSIPSIRQARSRSLRSRASSVFTMRSSEKSVIHLAEERGPLDLPYVIDGVGADGGGR